MLAPSSRYHRTQKSLVNDEKLMLIEPAVRESEQSLAVIRAVKLLAKHPNERAPMMAGEPLESECIAGDLLMFDQGRGTPVHRAQRCQVRGSDAEAVPQVSPQQWRHHPHRIQKPAAHAQKSNLQGKPQLELGPPTLIDNPGFLRRELEEHLHLEGRYLPRQVSPTQKCRMPAVHCALPDGGTIHPGKI